MKKRVLSILLALVLALGAAPAAVAEAVDNEEVQAVQEQEPEAELAGAGQVSLEASTRKSMIGSDWTTVTVKLTNKGEAMTGNLLCAAYDKSGRMLDFVNKNGVDLTSNGKNSVTLELHAPQNADFKVFLTDSESVPVAAAVEGKAETGHGGGIGGDNETEILKSMPNTGR